MNIDVAIKTLINELKSYWQTFIPKKEFLQGTIKKILHDNEKGKNGFLTSDQKDYYFTIPIHINLIDKIEEKVNVYFEVIQLKDGKERAKIIKITE